MSRTAVILAGGLGTRLRSVVGDLHKPLAPVNGKPFLNYLLDYLSHYRFSHVVLSVGYKAGTIREVCGTEYRSMAIDYAVEEQPLGTGGGMRLAIGRCDADTVCVLNGDSFFDVQLDKFYADHADSGARVSIALRRVDDASRYGSIAVDANHTVTAFREKAKAAGPGLVNGGVYLVERSWFLSATPPGKPFSVENDLFGPTASTGAIRGFEHTGYFIDIGVPEDYARAQHELKGSAY